MIMILTAVLLILVLPVFRIAAEECTLPDEAILTNLLTDTLIFEGENETLLTELAVDNHTFTCLAAGDTLHHYKYLSVIAQYKKNPLHIVEYGQYQAECGSELWEIAGEFQQRNETYFNVPLREDCFYCTTFTNDNNCIGCHESCAGEGSSGKCTGSGANSCCPVYDNGICEDNCPVNYIPNANNFYQCECNQTCLPGYQPSPLCDECNFTDVCLSDQPCENGGQCILNNAPADYYCSCTDNFNGTNCSECIIQCNPGYTALIMNCSCELSNICEALAPCENGGSCVLDSMPDQFSCSCLNSYDPNTNCSECALNCQVGFIPDSNCFECILNDACEAFTPCENGGTCIIDAVPDQFSCDCTNSYDSNTNCSECALNCQAGFVPDGNCFECILNDACEAFTPCLNGGTCTLGIAPDQFSCDCTNSYDSNTNCSVCALNCQVGFVPDGNCFECILNDACEAFTPCENGGTCTLDTAPDQFSCNCSNNYDPISNCSVCSLECQVGYIANESCLQCILSDICDADNPCLDNEQCNLLSPPDNYTCIYTNETNGTDCNITCSTEGYYVNLNVCRCEIDDICVVNSPCKNGGTCLPRSLPKQYQCICTDDYMNENCTVSTGSNNASFNYFNSLWFLLLIPVIIISVLLASMATVYKVFAGNSHNKIHQDPYAININMVVQQNSTLFNKTSKTDNTIL